MHEVTCVGNIVADTIAKTVDKLPEEGKLDLIEQIELHLGGCASNAAVDLQKLGVSTAVIGKVGNDGFGSFVINENGNDITKYFYVEGSMLFSYAAYIQKKESSASIQALEDSEIRVASMSDLEEALNNDHQLMLLFKSKLDEVLMMKDQRASSFTMLNSTDRYRQFLVDYPGLEDRVRQYHLASYLGITPVSLSRIRKKLGIIK